MEHGESVSLRAHPDTGRKFADWSSCPGDDEANPCAFVMRGAETVAANAFPLKTYTLTVTKPSNGYIAWGTRINCGSGENRTACTETVEHGESVSLRAHPDTGRKFADWSSCPGDDEANPCAFVMRGAETVAANAFPLKTYTLEVTEPSNGYIAWGTRINCGSGENRTACTETVEHGESVSLRAHPDTGREFADWSSCPGDDEANPCVFVMRGAETVAANAFPLKKYKLTVTKPSNGYVEDNNNDDVDIDCGSGTSQADCVDNEVEHGTSVSLEAHPDTGREFAKWSSCPGGADANPCVFVMRGAETVAANAFPLKKYKLTVTKPSNGYVEDNNDDDVDIDCGSGTSQADCVDNEVEHGTSVSLEAHPDTGREFAKWSSCPGGADANPCVFVMRGAETVAANAFPLKKYKLTVTKPSNGYVEDNNDDDVDIDCGSGTSQADCVDNEVEHGTSVSLEAHPGSVGYEFDEWTGKCAGQATATCTFRMVAPATAGATFKKKEYTLTVTSSSKGYVTWGTGQSQRINCGSGTGRTDCTETVTHDTSISLEATPNTGYRLKDWTCSPSSSSCPPAKMTGNLTVTPNFEAILTVDAGGPYQGVKVPGRRLYSVTVRATASGGASPYSMHGKTRARPAEAPLICSPLRMVRVSMARKSRSRMQMATRRRTPRRSPSPRRWAAFRMSLPTLFP